MTETRIVRNKDRTGRVWFQIEWQLDHGAERGGWMPVGAACQTLEEAREQRERLLDRDIIERVVVVW